MNLLKVVVYFVNGTCRDYLVDPSEVKMFVEAFIKLHAYPGYNPHSRLSTTKVWKITAAPLIPVGPYWWTSPSLHPHTPGARFFDEDFNRQEVLFLDEEILRNS